MSHGRPPCCVDRRLTINDPLSTSVVILMSDPYHWLEGVVVRYGFVILWATYNALDRIWEKRFDFLVNSPQYVAQLLLSL